MNCLKCSKEIVSRKSSKYCSLRCQRNYLKALYRRRYPEKAKEAQRRYLNGNTRVQSKQRDAALKYFDYQCYRCSSKENLELNHVKPLKSNGDNRARNLIVLCKKCHVDWHKCLDVFWSNDPLSPTSMGRYVLGSTFQKYHSR